MFRLACLSVLSLWLLSGCASSFDRKAAAREAEAIYETVIAGEKDVFQGIRLYGEVPQGFEPTGESDRASGCLWYRKATQDVFNQMDLCGDSARRVSLIVLYKDFDDEKAARAFFEEAAVSLSQKYGGRQSEDQTRNKKLWSFKNRGEWVSYYVKFAEEEARYGTYGRILKTPDRSEIHDKLHQIRLVLHSSVDMQGKGNLAIRDFVTVEYVSRLAEILKGREKSPPPTSKDLDKL